jgi:hypothetical protein
LTLSGSTRDCLEVSCFAKSPLPERLQKSDLVYAAATILTWMTADLLLFVDEENLLDADAILPAMMVKEPASP